jgi:hypothetical protein
VVTGGTAPITYGTPVASFAGNVAASYGSGNLTFSVTDPWTTPLYTEFASDSPVVVLMDVTDGLGNTLTVCVQVDPFPRKGDVGGFGVGWDVADALSILKYAATDPSIVYGPKQLEAADYDDSNTDGFSNDGVTAFDAYLVYVLATGPKAMENVVAEVSTRVSYGEPERNNVSVRLPIELNGDLENVTSLQLSTQIDLAQAKVESITVPDGWLMAYHVTEEGILRVAAAATEGTVPTSGTVGYINLTLSNADAQLTLAGDAKVNGSAVQTLDAIEVVELPEEFALLGNYPNPFNPSTNISFDLPQTAQVSIEVYDLVGRRVMTLPTQEIQAGAKRTVQLDASMLASGSYFYRVIAKTESQTVVETGRMMLVK